MSNIFDSMTSKVDEKPNGASRETTGDDLAPADKSAVAPADSASKTPRDVKEVTQELLRCGYIEASRKPELFRKADVHRSAIEAVLEPLDLALHLDNHRGVAFLGVGDLENPGESDEQAWSHPLVRRKRLTLEQSLLVAILRQAFVVHEQESGVGESPARVAVDDLLPQFLTYFQDSGSDAKNESRLLNLLDQLKTHGIVTEVDKKHEVTIRPLIAHLANPQSLAALLETLENGIGKETTNGRE